MTLIFCIVISGVVESADLSNCAVLNIPGETYYLTADIKNYSSASYCFRVNQDGITLDCQGHYIDGKPGISNGIELLGKDDFELRNCVITDIPEPIDLYSGTGPSVDVYIHDCELEGRVEMYNSKNSTIEDVIISGSGHGLSVAGSNNLVINRVNASGVDYGVYDIGSTNTNISDCYFDGGQMGLYFSNTKGATVQNTHIVGYTMIGAQFLGTAANNSIYNCFFNNSGSIGNGNANSTSSFENFMNIAPQSGSRIYSIGSQIGGNFYANSTGGGYSETCTDLDADGFCDDILNMSGSGVLFDYYPYSNSGVLNNAPSISTPSPANNSYIYEASEVDIIFNIYDADDNFMNVDVVKFHADGSNSSCNYYAKSSGSQISCTWTEEFNLSQKYNWTVYVSDGTDSYYGQYFFSGSKSDHIITFQVYDSDNFIPIGNATIKVGSHALNLTTTLTTNSTGQVKFGVKHQESYTYRVWHDDYITSDYLSLTWFETQQNWTESVMLEYDWAYVNFYIHVWDILLNASLDGVFAVVSGDGSSNVGTSNSTGQIHFSLIEKGIKNITLSKTGYITASYIFEITKNNQIAYYAMLNESAWNVSTYNITVHITDNKSVDLNNVLLDIENLNLLDYDFEYTNQQGRAYIYDMHEGNIKITMLKQGYHSLAYFTFLNSNLNLSFIMKNIIIPPALTVFLSDKITFGTINNAEVCIYLKNCSGDYYNAYCSSSNMLGLAFFNHIGKNNFFKISVNHSQYPYTITETYEMDTTKTIHIELSNIFHTYPIYITIVNTSGSGVGGSNIIVYHNGIKIRENTLIGNTIIYDLKSDEKYKFVVSHQNYHSKTEVIQNHNKILSMTINLTRSDQINPENPFNIGTYGWSDFFGLMSMYGLPLFILLFIYFVYRTLTTKDKEYNN